ncbi:MAG: tetratricopeptide repeat protein, partial [Magnetococcus sp. DMHC-8]
MRPKNTHARFQRPKRVAAPPPQPAVDLARAIQEALQIHQAGQLDAAEAIYRKVLAIQPENPDALHLLGFICHQRNQGEKAAELVGKAVALQPDRTIFLNNYGIILTSLGRREEAMECYRRALRIQPDFYMALGNLGGCLADLGQQEESIACYQKALAANPNGIEVLNSLGNVLLKAGRYQEAIASYQRAITIQPNYADAYNGMGTALRDSGQFEESIAWFHKGLELHPNHYDIHTGLGNALLAFGKPDEALNYYEQAIRINPNHPNAYHNLGGALRSLGKFAEAIAYFQKALTLNPNLHQTHNSLGNTLYDQDRMADAFLCYQKALSLQPNDPDTLNNLGIVLTDLGKLEEAIDCYKKLAMLAPRNPAAQCDVINQLLHICDWREVPERYQQMMTVFHAEKKETSPFVCLALPTTPAEQRRGAELYMTNKYPVRADLSATRQYDPQPERLKIGYLSSDFANHPVAYLTAELLELHDRSRFEITAYSYGPDDGREMRKRIMAASDHFVDLRPLTFADAAQRIFDDGTHVLMDLNGFTKHARMQIPALRPAPIQASWLGYLGTLGAPFIDYLISDSFITPPGCEADFTEKLVRLPECFQPNDRQRNIAEHTPTRQERGLPEQGVVFASFNKSYKFNPETFDVWMSILRKAPNSILWLVASNHLVETNLRREAEARGVSQSRIFFVPKMPLADYLANYRLVDLVLDTFPYNSGTTASNSLWAGCPMLTCAGKTFVSRQAGSLLRTVGLPELVTHSLEEYESVALELAGNPARLTTLRQRLQANLSTTPLFDTPRFTKHLEAAYESMWHRFRSGLPPDHLDVPPINGQVPPHSPSGTTPSRREATTAAAVQETPASDPEDPPRMRQAAIPIQPTLSEAHNNVGNLLRAKGKLDEALLRFQKALAIHPRSHETCHAMGTAMLRLGRIETIDCHQQAVRINPQSHPACNSLGDAVQHQDNPEEAEIFYNKALSIRPDDPEALRNLGVLRAYQGRLDESVDCYRQAVTLSPESPALRCELLHRLLHICDWRDFQSSCQQMLDLFRAGEQEASPFIFLTLPTSPAEYKRCAELYTKNRYPTRSNLAATRSYENNPDRLTIGYLSYDYREHPCGHVAADLFPQHDRTRVKVIAYSLCPEDGSAIRGRVKAGSDLFVDLHLLNHQEAAQRILDDGVHILVDANGFTRGTRLEIAALRPAPIQATWQGNTSMTMGAPFFDYCLTDYFMAPPGCEPQFVEKLVRLPHHFQSRRTVAQTTPTRRACALPEEGFVFVCFNQPYKINPPLFDCWMRLLREIPDSVLWLRVFNTWAVDNLRCAAENRGVPGSRLVFAPWTKDSDEHVARYRLADLALDTYPYTSGSTGWDALSAGCPMVSCAGETGFSRNTASQLIHVGLPDLVAHSLEAYEQLAMALANDPDRLAAIRKRLRANLPTAPLFDAPLFARHLETAYRAMWQQFQAGLAPDHIHIAPLPNTIRPSAPLPLRPSISQEYGAPVAQKKKSAPPAAHRTRRRADTTSHMQQAFQHHRAGRLPEAESIYRQVVAMQPDHGEALHQLGCICHQQGQPLAASQWIGKALLSQPDHPVFLKNIGVIQAELGLWAEAASSFRRLLIIRPDDPDTLCRLGESLYHQGNFAEAEGCYRQAIARQPTLHAAHHGLGNLLRATGNLPEAIACYRKTLELFPAHHNACINMGRLLLEQGETAEAIACFRQVLAILPTHHIAMDSLGTALRMEGKLDEAIACHQQALTLQPTYHAACHNQGVVLQIQGKNEQAIACYQKTLTIQPDAVPTHHALGALFLQENRCKEAIPHFQQAIANQPNHVDACRGLGTALRHARRLPESILWLQKGLAIHPDHYDMQVALGMALMAYGKPDEAMTCYHRAIERHPDRANAYHYLGEALQQLGKQAEAIAWYQQALAIDPSQAQTHNCLGIALYTQNREEEAVACYQKALDLRPDDPYTLNNLAIALTEQGKLVESIACYQRAVATEPNLLSHQCELLHHMLHICDWNEFHSRYQQMMALFHREPQAGSPFIFLTLPISPDEYKQCAELSMQRDAPVRDNLSARQRHKSDPDRLKIGYLSFDYKDHPCGYVAANLFPQHDRSQVEVIAYSLAPDDGSTVRKRIVADSDQFVDLHLLDHQAAARRILDDGVHILVDTNGFTQGMRPQILALRPAPIQVTWQGSMGTLGAPFIDYCLMDYFLAPPGSERYFTEKLVRLPTYIPARRTVVNATPSRQSCGLPEEGFLFVCFNQPYKINPPLFDCWMRLLRQIPGSLLWLRE